MTIDTNELRRLAQAATPGPWYVTGKLTRYVEARIDGGLIQEVAACGPTKADGGYGPQQEANARLIAAANPATISELLDRLEAAEKERDTLRAKVERMEKQEPHSYIYRYWDPLDGSPVWRHESGNWNGQQPGACAPLYALPGAQAQPAPSVPEKITRVEPGFKGMFLREAQAYKQGWNECRAAMLAAAPEAKP